MINFHANFVCLEIVEEYEEGIYIAFVDNEQDSEEYLVLQKSFEVEEDEVRLGMDKVYIEYMDQGCSTYGEINKVTINNTAIEIILKQETAAKLDVDQIISISFNETENVNNLKHYLLKMFEGKEEILCL